MCVNNKKKKIIIILLVIITILVTSLVAIFVYDRATINNQYSINEANLNIPVFVYHDIVDDSSKIKYDYMQTSKDVFENQIKGLKDFGYHFITYEDLQKYKNNEIKLYKRSCLLTFDDGLEGVYKNAYPIAKKYDVPFTMYIITNNMEQEGVITWDQAKEMQESGLVTIASHSVNHPEFTSLSVEEAVKNVNDSYEVIENKLGKQPIKIFTYPYGLYKEEQVEELAKQGYIQNLTDNKINKSKNLDLSRLHRCYPLNDSLFKILLKIQYRSFKYN